MKFRVWLAGKLVCPKLKYHYNPKFDACYSIRTTEIFMGDDAWIDDMGFLRHLREVHGCKEWNFVGVSTWALLHEIGHYHTIDYTEDDLATRALCAMVPAATARKSIKIQDMYFGIETEWEATEWAIDWVHKHPCFSRLVNRLLQKGV